MMVKIPEMGINYKGTMFLVKREGENLRFTIYD